MSLVKSFVLFCDVKRWKKVLFGTAWFLCVCAPDLDTFFALFEHVAESGVRLQPSFEVAVWPHWKAQEVCSLAADPNGEKRLY